MSRNTETTSREGELLAGKYRMEARLGAGGMGEVYRARNEFIGRQVAIKLLHSQLAQHREVVTRFVREAKAANIVRHPNVVDVLDIGLQDDGAPFIVQELLEGQDLGEYLQRVGGRLATDVALAIFLPVAEAVGVAHARGVVHRDLKPENVYLCDADGGVVPKVLDFGISKIADSENQRVTVTGAPVGTPAYMSPEQIQRSSGVDARTDVWALGVMLYEMLAGKLPFEAATHGGLFVKICIEDPIPLESVVSELPPQLVAMVKRCLLRQPEGRYASAAELAVEVRQLLQSRGVATPSAGAVVQLTLPPRAAVDSAPPKPVEWATGPTTPALPSRGSPSPWAAQDADRDKPAVTPDPLMRQPAAPAASTAADSRQTALGWTHSGVPARKSGKARIAVAALVAVGALGGAAFAMRGTWGAHPAAAVTPAARRAESPTPADPGAHTLAEGSTPRTAIDPAGATQPMATASPTPAPVAAPPASAPSAVAPAANGAQPAVEAAPPAVAAGASAPGVEPAAGTASNSAAAPANNPGAAPGVPTGSRSSRTRTATASTARGTSSPAAAAGAHAPATSTAVAPQNQNHLTATPAGAPAAPVAAPSGHHGGNPSSHVETEY